jgi:hypothetical protein
VRFEALQTIITQILLTVKHAHRCERGWLLNTTLAAGGSRLAIGHYFRVSLFLHRVHLSDHVMAYIGARRVDQHLQDTSCKTGERTKRSDTKSQQKHGANVMYECVIFVSKAVFGSRRQEAAHCYHHRRLFWYIGEPLRHTIIHSCTERVGVGPAKSLDAGRGVSAPREEMTRET